MTDRKPRILIAVDWYLPGFKGGGPIRSVANMAPALSDNFEFWILTSDRDHGDKQPYPGLAVDQWTDGTQGEKVWYCSPDAQSYRHIKAILADLDYDLLYLNSVFSLTFSIFPMWLSRANHPEKPVLLAPRGMLHPGALSLKPTKKKIFIKALNFLGLPKQIQFHATDTQEITDIRLQFGKESVVHLASNIGPAILPESKKIDKEKGKLKLVYLSRLSAKKGLDFLLECLKTQTANIELAVIGPDEEPGYWEKCQAIIATLPVNVRVAKLEAIPPTEAIRTIQDSHVFVLPTKGENFGHAIIEAMTAGRPVFISDQTPWRNLGESKAGMDIPLSNPAEWTEQIRRFAAMDQAEFDQWESGSRAFAANQITHNVAKDQTLEMFQAAIAHKQA